MLIPLLSFAILLALTFLTFNIWKNLNRNTSEKTSKKLDIDDAVNMVKQEISDILSTGVKRQNEDEKGFKRNVRARSSFLEALKRCIYGSISDKLFVKDVIYDILRNSDEIDKMLNDIISFDTPSRLSAIDKFDILLYVFKKGHGKNALKEIIKKYSLDEPKIKEDGKEVFEIEEKDIERIYTMELPFLDTEDRTKILAQRIYQRYKGFSVVDEIRDMNIDGLSGGVSGISTVDVMNDFDLDKDFIRVPRNYENAWIFFEGKSIHLSFLSFGSEAELKRVCMNIYRYNSSGMLSNDVGYKVSEMMDGSRVVVVRPDFSESWAFFVRKFQLQRICLEELIKDDNAELVINFIKFLAKGGRISAITGSQGSGKTTLLMAMVGEIYSGLTLRVQEMSSELHLRRLYPKRNILSFKETATISGQEGLDVQKKTDGSVNILGEVASDEVAAWMIQMAQVASLFTIFTHHAKRAEDLILSLRNSLLKEDVFRNEKIAEEQVVNVLDFDIHLKRDYSGKRYIERITEIISVDRSLKIDRTFKSKAANEKMDGFMDSVCDYFEYVGRGPSFEARDIIRFNNNRYEVVSDISEKQKAEMLDMMRDDDKLEFQSYLNSLKAELV